MDAKMKALDNKVADVAANVDWPQWEMDAPTYKHPQADFEIDASPGAREFHRTNHGNRDGTSKHAIRPEGGSSETNKRSAGMTTAEAQVINLADARSSQEAKVFSGRLRGKHWRKGFGLDELDREPGIVVVKIPSDVFSVNMSFFLGLFGESVRALRKEGFEGKYQFECDSVLLPSIRQGIERALKESSALPNSAATGAPDESVSA